MARVVHRAADNTARVVSDMAAQLAMTQEMAEIQAERIEQLERDLAEKTAELARATQAADELQHRIDHLEQPPQGENGDAGAAPGGPGES